MTPFASPFDQACVINVIRTTLLRRGEGTQSEPLRVITQYWTMDGELLWEIDPCNLAGKP